MAVQRDKKIQENIFSINTQDGDTDQLEFAIKALPLQICIPGLLKKCLQMDTQMQNSFSFNSRNS